jgi:hypothetical protein
MARTAFVEMTHQDDRALMLFRKVGKRRQGVSHAAIAAELDGRVQKGNDRIDDYQLGLGPLKRGVQGGDVAGQAEHCAAGAVTQLQDEDPIQVGAQRLQAWPDGVGGAILGVEYDHIGRAGAGAAIGKIHTGAKAGA